MNNETSSIIDQNEREYEGLIVSLEANQERLNILICVCDQEKLREEIIDRYSKELEPVIPCYRIDLDQKEPSLRAAIASLVSRKPELLQSKNAVITTTGVEKLHSIEWQQEKSELDKFWLFGLCYAMDGGYKGWNPYRERHLAIFVNCFLSRAN